MITAIEIENFKGIGERQRIELKPITLLFGPNCAGKSSVLQALHYAREIFERSNLDARQTVVGGDSVDLGGFCNFVHGRDRSRSIAMRFDFDTHGVDWQQFISMWEQITGYARIAPGGDPWHDLVTDAYIEFSVQWDSTRDRPRLGKYVVGLNGTHLATLTYNPLAPARGTYLPYSTTFHANALLQDYVRKHAPWARSSEGDRDQASQPCVLRQVLDEIPAEAGFGLRNGGPPTSWNYEVVSGVPDPDLPPSTAQAVKTLTGIVLAHIMTISDALSYALYGFAYLGPLRAKPDRHFEPRNHDSGRWANGLGAWDLVHDKEAAFIEEVSCWLSAPECLDTGYSLRRHEFLEINTSSPVLAYLESEDSLDEKQMRELKARFRDLPVRRRVEVVHTGSGLTLSIRDLGEGIAQVVPVIVAALSTLRRLWAIEQPELHVHPAVQVRLGDLFIESLHTRAHVLVIETHSEHLLLRLLRRIRETHDNELPDGHPGLKPKDVSVVFLEQAEGGCRATQLRIDETGEFIDRWPRGFFEERAEELF